jgi:hypothetical protein
VVVVAVVVVVVLVIGSLSSLAFPLSHTLAHIRALCLTFLLVLPLSRPLVLTVGAGLIVYATSLRWSRAAHRTSRTRLRRPQACGGFTTLSSTLWVASTPADRASSSTAAPLTAPASSSKWATWRRRSPARRSRHVVVVSLCVGRAQLTRVVSLSAVVRRCCKQAAPIHQHDRVVAVDGVYKGTEGTVLYEPDGEDVIVKGREGQVDIIQMASVVKLA